VIFRKVISAYFPPIIHIAKNRNSKFKKVLKSSAVLGFQQAIKIDQNVKKKNLQICTEVREKITEEMFF
jgi:hypothetical protein